MEQPKARLTLQQHQQAINEAIWIDASPHEWPTVDKMWLLCSALIDSVQMVHYLRSRLVLVQAERDAARAGVARAVEACQSIEEALQGTDFADHGLASPVWNALELVRDVTADKPALDWLAQQRAEAAEAERRANTDVIRSLGPAFCDFFFDGPGDADYLAGVLAQQRSEAAAEALESVRIGWLSDNNYRPGVPEIWRYIANRAAALRAGGGE